MQVILEILFIIGVVGLIGFACCLAYAAFEIAAEEYRDLFDD